MALGIETRSKLSRQVFHLWAVPPAHEHDVWSYLLQLWDFQGASREAHSVPSIRLHSIVSSKLEEMNPVFTLFHKPPSYHSYKNDWYPSLLSLALMKTTTKSNWRIKTGLLQVIEGSQRSSGQELKQAWRKAAYLLPLAHRQRPFSYVQDHLPRG